MKTKTILLEWDTNEIGDIVLYLEIQTEDEQTEETRIINKEEFLEALGFEIENGMILSVEDGFNGEHFQTDHKEPIEEISIDYDMAKEYCELKGIEV
jgi:hypothetical protein